LNPFNLISSFAIVIPAILAGIFFKKHAGLRIFSIYLFVALTFEMAFFYTALNSINNWSLFDFFSLAEFLLLSSWIIYQISFKGKWYLPAGLGLVLLISTLVKPDYNLINVHMQNGMLFIGFGCYLVWLMKQHTKHNLAEDARLWIGGGLFLHFAAECLIFTLTTFLTGSDELKSGTYFLYLISSINLFSYIIFCKAYLCKHPLTR
jgi:hypothetical protein